MEKELFDDLQYIKNQLKEIRKEILAYQEASKNLVQPDVIKSVCGCIGTQLGRITNDKICGRCGKPKRE